MLRKIESDIIEEIKQKWSDLKSYFGGCKEEDIGTDLLARVTWKPARDLTFRQCEETFCDFFGLRIFGESFLYAFAYLIAPQRKGGRSPFYPNNKDRARYLVDASGTFGYAVSKDYDEHFENQEEPGPEFPKEMRLLTLADAVRDRMVRDLLAEADKIVDRSKIQQSDESLVEKCCENLTLMVPAENSGGSANILNAAWKGWLDQDFFADPTNNERRLANLREVILKSVEILEIESKLNDLP